jgi:hypothetical protein
MRIENLPLEEAILAFAIFFVPVPDVKPYWRQRLSHAVNIFFDSGHKQNV